MSRIITGKVRLDFNRCELQPVIEAAIEIVRPTAEVKAVRLRVDLDENVGPVYGDCERLQQVVWNLLSNAVKFTPAGGWVQVNLHQVAGHAEIAVEDSGTGIKADFLPHVFDRFRQADGSTTRTHGGLGLGLAIVRHLVELHGGSASAESEGEGHGARFTVSLPLMSSQEPRSEYPTTEPKSVAASVFTGMTSLTGIKVLIVDDEMDARDLVIAMLEKRGAEVEGAESAAEGLERLQRWKPDVLIADIGMPVEDGYGLIRKVRALPVDQGGDTPAMALTAYARTEDRVRALGAGYQMHLAKPVDREELASVVARLATNKRAAS